MQKVDEALHVSISGDVKVPGQMLFKSPISMPIRTVSVNGEQISNFSTREVRIKALPARIVIISY